MSHAFVESLGLVLIRRQLLFPLFDVGGGFQERRRQFGVVSLQSGELGLPVFGDGRGTE